MKHLKSITNLCLVLLLTSITTACQTQNTYPDLDDGLYAEFITNKGTMVAKLFYDKTPVTVANFVTLAEGTNPKVTDSLKGKKYFDGLTFHRVMDKFMIQGGDPLANGMGNPGYRFQDEFDLSLKHDKPGILSMGNTGEPASNGSQFFITEVPTPWLDYKHSIFGELVKGLDVQDSISNVAVDQAKKPLEAVVLQNVNIIRKGDAAKAFNAVTVFTEQEPLLDERLNAFKDSKLAQLKEASRQAAKEFLSKNKDYKGEIKEFPTGLVMLYNPKPNAKTPTSSDRVDIMCAGFFEDGNLFYTNMKQVAEAHNQYDKKAEEAGAYKPFTMPYNETAGLVPGFREAMLNMNIGDKARVFIPSYLGYAERGRAPRVPPNTNLIFDIELVGIKK